MEQKSNLFTNPVLWLFLALTLGLAPYLPEPHIWEKLKWILSGAEGMQAIDWIDFMMHCTPCVVLSFLLIKKVLRQK